MVKGWHFRTSSRTQQVRSLLDVLVHGHGQPGFTAHYAASARRDGNRRAALCASVDSSRFPSAAASAHKLGHPCLANAWTPSDSVAARLRTVLLRRCWWPRRDALLLHPSFDLVLSMQDHASTDGLLPSLRQHGLAGRVNYPATQTRTDSQLSNEELPTSSAPVRRRDIFEHIFMVANVTPGGS